MGWFRGPCRLLGAVFLLVLLVPALALLPAAAVDRGPDGHARVSVFPIAIAAFDPFVWTCARNSAAVASAVAVGSLVIGVGLSLLVGRRRFWGRTLFWALAPAPLAAGPLLTAPGVALILGGERGWDWLAARSILGQSAEELVRWSALVWVGVATGVPLVALATDAALRRVEPSWTEAARAIGASRRRIWLEIVWPILRPNSARATAMVFTLTLVEPAAPLVLGLRRTLAVQMLGAATRLDQPTRTATLALLAIAIAVVGQVAIRWWGTPIYAQDRVPEAARQTSMNFRRASGLLATLLGWILFALGPSLILLSVALGTGLAAAHGSWSEMLRGWSSDPAFRTLTANSVTIAGLAIALDLTILASLGRRRLAGLASSPNRLVVRLLESIPPLTLGVGALATPWLLGILVGTTGEVPGRWLGTIARELSPARSPGFLLILCLAAIRLPMLARFADLAGREIRPARFDAAKLMAHPIGAKIVENRWLGVIPARPALLALALAATNLAPALLLTPFAERRTLAPAVLQMEPGGELADPRATGPIVLILTLNLMAFGLASRSRERPMGDWFSG